MKAIKVKPDWWYTERASITVSCPECLNIFVVVEDSIPYGKFIERVCPHCDEELIICTEEIKG